MREGDMKDLTICVKTFIRPKTLDKCLESIRARYPDVKILVANDGPDPIVNNKADQVFNLPFDVGLSAGRNYLLDRVETEFVMFIDDDTIFSETSKVEDMLGVLHNNSEIDLAAGKIRGNSFCGTLEKEHGILFRNVGSYSSIISGFKIYDYVLNLFVARTSKVKEVRWDEELKIVEHMDFFWRAKGVLRCTALDHVYFHNTRERDAEYSKFRVGRIPFFMQKQCEKIGVTEIRDRRK